MSPALGRITGFLVIEVTLFAAASLTHGGWTIKGYEHARAAIAEAVIASVLVLGLILGLALPALARRTALAVQGLALLGVLVGLLTIAQGVGPATLPDLAVHGLLLLTLVTGFLVVLRAK